MSKNYPAIELAAARFRKGPRLGKGTPGPPGCYRGDPSLDHPSLDPFDRSREPAALKPRPSEITVVVILEVIEGGFQLLAGLALLFASVYLTRFLSMGIPFMPELLGLTFIAVGGVIIAVIDLLVRSIDLRPKREGSYSILLMRILPDGRMFWTFHPSARCSSSASSLIIFLGSLFWLDVVL